MAFAKFFNFRGRSRRKEFWYFLLFSILASFLISMIGQFGAASGLLSEQLGNSLNSVYYLGTLVPATSVAVRRMHDTGRSGWFVLLPFYNLYCFCLDSQKGENKYGADSKADERSV